MKISRRYVISLILGSTGFAMIGCSQGFVSKSPSMNMSQFSGSSGVPASTTSGLMNSYEQKAMSILTTNCTSCHTASSGPSGVFGLTDLTHLQSAGLVVPGQPSQSLIYNAISSGSMPPSGALASADQQAIAQWIMAAAPQATPTPAPGQPTPTPAPGHVPTPTPAPMATPTPAPAATFSSIEANILSNNCVGCHSGLATYNGVLNYVNTANPTQSALYTQTSSGAMPKGGTRLSSAQVNQILTWIQSGAPNN